MKELALLIHRLGVQTRILRTIIELQGKKEDLTERELLILELFGQKEEMGISEIGEHFESVATSTISNDITNLWSKKGLLKKEIDPSNQRARIVKLTPKGKKKLGEIMQKKAKIFNAIINSLDLDDKEYKWLVDLLKDRALPRMDKTIEELKNKKPK